MKDSENIIRSMDFRSQNYRSWNTGGNKLERQDVMVSIDS